MKTRSWKRFGSCLLALSVVLSSTVLPANAATPGKDGSAEMNEAYAAHESPDADRPLLQCGLPFWNGLRNPTLTPRYSRASIPLADRKGRLRGEPEGQPGGKADALLSGKLRA